MIKQLVSIAFFALSVPVGLGADVPMSRAEMKASLRFWLLDMHGGSAGIPAQALRLDKSGVFPLDSMKDLLLEIAADKSYNDFGRENALSAFVQLEPTDERGRLEPFYLDSARNCRAAIHYGILRALPDLHSKLIYAKKRLDWLASHPDFQKDAFFFDCFFQTVLEYDNPSEDDRKAILAFYRTEAEHAVFFESANDAEMLLMRHDPAWPTNEARRAMMRKWIDDPGIHEKTRALWTAALDSFEASQAVGAVLPGAQTDPSQETSAGERAFADPPDADPKPESSIPPAGISPGENASRNRALPFAVAGAVLLVLFFLVARRTASRANGTR